VSESGGLNSARLGLVVRWILGAPIAALTGAGTVASGAALARSGWDRESFLAGLACVWVCAGAIAYLAGRDVGRQVLLGATAAVGLFSAAVVILVAMRVGHSFLLPRATVWVCALGVVISALLSIALRLLGVSGAMRSPGGGRRTSG
jgi:hypothetical protein